MNPLLMSIIEFGFFCNTAIVNDSFTIYSNPVVPGEFGFRLAHMLAVLVWTAKEVCIGERGCERATMDGSQID